MIYLVCGLQGSGKSTIAKILSEKIKADIISIDKVFGNTPIDSSKTKEYYNKAFEILSKNKSTKIIIEGVFASKKQRDKIKTISNKKVIIIYVKTPTLMHNIVRILKRKKNHFFKEMKQLVRTKYLFEIPKNKITIENNSIELVKIQLTKIIQNQK